MVRSIKTALISVFDKEGLEEIILKLNELGVEIYSTGGTRTFIEELGVHVEKVEELTGYPSILDGRVKTLHPKVFGGILAIRNEDHLSQLAEYMIPTLDLVVVDLYPFEDTVSAGKSYEDIIEKIDIGGISLIRAGAKNHQDVVVIPSKNQYRDLKTILESGLGESTLEQRRYLAAEAFKVSSHYDTAIFNYLADANQREIVFKSSVMSGTPLRYGENPHQKASYFGNLDKVFEKLNGKELSFNNLVDIDAAVQLMKEFKSDLPTFAILKHTNPCGVATRPTALEAWEAALQADPVSAFGGVLISNAKIDLNTAQQIDKIFYEVLIAPDYDDDAIKLLMANAKRNLLKLKSWPDFQKVFKSLLNGVIVQDADISDESCHNSEVKTDKKPTVSEIVDMDFGIICAKHLKSNTIVLVKDKQMLGMGCGHTSRIDACQQAIDKAKKYGFDLQGSVMISDAFFPFPDCVELAVNEGITAVAQPGGSIKDQLSIDFCNVHNISMVFTGIRHFRH
ncbi:MAG: bifunctional phosphoribosylaminoimidazolecarboxamide formyltransferase/IMP cyclohydrolase [Saprospiraceae bacterium]|nr:bifunctional phosphoribosylaminoimidazolecarboxamide formyltransferase/IMP cyclohydrolase [Saprospiraceae bacterium]